MDVSDPVKDVYIIFGLDGKRFCDCITYVNGNVVLDTGYEKIMLNSLNAQAYNRALASKRRGKRGKSRHK